ncbi:hypothetical protein ACA910_016019 [Epithemia clementina (nom. ined.)]
MNNYKQLYQRFINTSSRLLRESWELTKRLPQSSNQGWREACLDLTRREDNQLARSILKFDKELHLMRYHGLWSYFRQYYHQRHQLQHVQSTGNSSSAMGSSGNINSINNHSYGMASSNRASSAAVAKIPFVITTSMKEALGSEVGLGYTADQIKKLTPLKAALLIQHKVDPNEMDSRLPQILLDHEKQEEEQQQKIQQHRKQQKQAAEKGNKNSASSASASSPSVTSLTPSRNAVEHILWYRVVEVIRDTTNGNATEEVVGLHRTLQQAQDDCTLRHELAVRNDRDFPNVPKPERQYKVVAPSEEETNNSNDAAAAKERSTY